MAYRSGDAPAPSFLVPADPLARFAEILAAFDAERGTFEDKVPLRLAAIHLVTTPGEPAALAEATRARVAAMRERLGRLGGIDAPVRMVLAASLVKYDEDALEFLDEVERVRRMFRAIELRRGGVYEALATLVLRRGLSGAAIDTGHVTRLREIYEAMKGYHWWLTGPEDFPACAMLVPRPGSAAEIGAAIEAVYQALHTRAHLWRGDALQTAANVLVLSGLAPAEVADRFALLVERFREGGARVGQAEYDELAILCFLAQPVERVVATVLEFRDRIRASLGWTEKGSAFNLAANLAFVRLVGADGELGTIADAKLLLDMQAIVVARQAAAAVVAT